MPNRNSQPIVSLLIPVYNVEKYLAECLDSALAQTLSDIEIICIDDGSTDASGAMLDEYAKKDQRVKVIHKQNSGYGASMNRGLDAATGEFVGIRNRTTPCCRMVSKRSTMPPRNTARTL